MKTETFQYSAAKGWSLPAFPALDGERTLVLAFGASRFADESAPLKELRAAYPRAHVVGCSTSGEILDDVVQDDSITVSVTRFDATRLRTVHATVDSADQSFHAGEELARDLMDDELRAVLVLSDGLNVNGSELVRGLNSV